jgi:hypothetical protein
LNPGTTAGDIDYYTSSTAKARVAIGTAGQVLQVNAGATAPEWAAPAGGLTSPLTTKGDIWVYGTGDTRLPVGTDGHTLVADSVEATGLKWAAPAASGTRGLQEIIPTSVAVTAGTATVGANGKITLSAAQNLSVNGCFTSTYTNYVVVADLNGDSSGADCIIRMRASGTDNTTATSYKTERFYIYAGTLTSQSTNTTYFNAIAFAGSNGGTGFTINFFRPFLAKETLIGNIVSPVGGFGNYYAWSGAGVHTEATSYDGFTILLDQNTSGNLTVFGWSE